MATVNWLGTGGRQVTAVCPEGHVWVTRSKTTGPGFQELQVSECPDCGREAVEVE